MNALKNTLKEVLVCINASVLPTIVVVGITVWPIFIALK